MKEFALLVQLLGTSTKTNKKLQAIQDYFATASDEDKVWVIALFTGRRPKRTVNGALLVDCCLEITQLSGWLFEESYHTVGDLAEAIALLLPVNDDNPDTHSAFSLSYFMQAIAGIGKKDEAEKKLFVKSS